MGASYSAGTLEKFNYSNDSSDFVVLTDVIDEFALTDFIINLFLNSIF